VRIDSKALVEWLVRQRITVAFRVLCIAGERLDSREPAKRGLGALPFLLPAMVVVRGIDALASASHNVALPVLAAPMQDGAAFLSRFWVAWAIGFRR
jgi:hypothetical protein